MRIELTASQHTDLVDILNAWAALCRREAAAFARLDIAQPLAVERVQQAQTAEDLLHHLAQF